MTVVVPPELGSVGETDDDAERLSAISAHVHAVMTHRGLTPAEQVTALLQLAVGIVAEHVDDSQRGMRFVANLAGACFAMAQRVRREERAAALRDAAPAGRA